MDAEFEWDETKSAQCQRDRGFDFAYAVQAFLDPGRSVETDDRHDYGEARHRLYGRIEGRLFAVVYTVRRRVIRIISARKANAREIGKHGDRKDTPEA